jgi:hypothetical protein
MSFRIDARQLIETGIDHVDFDPSKVKLKKDFNDDMPDFGNIAERFLSYEYDDVDVAEKIKIGNDTFVKGSWDHWKKENLKIERKVQTKLRKKKGGSGWTDNSRIKHMDDSKRLDSCDLDWAKEQFEEAFGHFNDWYVEEQKKRVAQYYGVISAYNFTEKEVVDLEAEYSAIKAKLRTLSKEIVQTKYNLVTKDIKSGELGFSKDFTEVVLTQLEANQEKGDSGSTGFELF